MIALLVDLEVKAGRLEDFMIRIRQQADNSVTLEPECLQFDVSTDGDAPERVFLYEVYKDQAALDAHLTTPHFQEFDQAVRDMLVGKSLRVVQLHHRG